MIGVVQRIHERLWGCRRGGATTIFALGTPIIFGLAGVAIDYTTFSSQKTSLQGAADAAALAATRELQIGSPDAGRIQAIAQAVVTAQFERKSGDGPVKTVAVAVRRATGDKVATDSAVNGVQVTLTQRKNAIMSRLVTPMLTDMEVQATAQLAGGTKLCVIGLEELAPDAISMKNQAMLTAPGCSVYANSRDPKAINLHAEAKITALLTCSAGGYDGSSKNYAPRPPVTDCPKQQDPLINRPAPAVGPCLKTNHKVGSLGGLLLLPIPLDPGTYCGGLNIEGGAIVVLRPGVYVMKDGPLIVGPPLDLLGIPLAPAQLRGTNVGFYFTGTVAPDKKGVVAPLSFMKDSVVELTAPKTGPMAGLLLHEDRASPIGRLFDINSDTARKLVGTIYLSRGVFSVTSNQSVADQSEYTAIVARRLELDKKPNLFLNTRYMDTDVPVPEGLGPNSGEGRLVQ